MAQITSRKELEAWLKDKPADWAQVIAARGALRVLPYAYVHRLRDEWVKDFSHSLFRITSIFWAVSNVPTRNMVEALHLALRSKKVFADSTGYEEAAVATYAAIVAIADEGISACDAVARAIFSAARDGYVGGAVAAGDHASESARAAVWQNIAEDCDWLQNFDNPEAAAQLLTCLRLNADGLPRVRNERRQSIPARLLTLDPTYQVWIDWYNRRIEGHKAAFDIPGDSDRTEDKKILARLADATNEDFWDKGATYVNTTLQSWIDEGRERVAPKSIPPQEPDATVYGVNADGKLDRLPATDQTHLRDIPDQQRIYRDVRESALELQAEGQRLGARLERALGRFLHSAPENFADAECYSVWRDGNALRRIHLAHRAVAGGKDYDDKRLDPAMAEMLGDVLDRYNLFAFGDDGLRAKDEAAIPPQERVKAVDEAAKAAPLIEALLASPEIMTEVVRDDLLADQADQALPESDPYDDQALIQSNKSMRNRIAALLSGIGRQVKQSGKNVREGAERAVGALIVSEVAGVTTLHQPILAFAATHLTALKTYAGAAYSNSLQWLWDAISKLGDKF